MAATFPGGAQSGAAAPAGRLSRRRFVGGAATLGLAGAAAGLVGCSSSKNNAANNGARPTASSAAPSTAASTSSARGTAAATAASAARTPTPAAGGLDPTKGNPGGSVKLMLTGPLTSLILEASNFTGLQRQGGLTNSGLLAFRWGQESVPLTDFSFEPDLAQALPEQPDDLTLVYKLRPGVKFQNGRAVTSQDVAYSYDRYANWEKSVYKSGWQTWFDHTETPDPQTVLVKTKFPFADAQESTAANQDGFIVAKEYEESPQANEKLMGSGPFLYVSDQAPVSWTFHKNPDYFLKPYPYFDEIVVLSTTDPVARIANFTSHQVHMPWEVQPQERDQIKKQRPDARSETYPYPASVIYMRNDKPPFNDKRVRQALSMSIDRKAIRAATSDGEGDDDQFFPLAYSDLFGTHKTSDLGSATKYWNYDPQGAKQLLSAAGFDKPIEANISHYDASVIGQWYVDQVSLSQSQWSQAGIANVKLVNLLGPQFAATVRLGNYDGMAVGLSGLSALQRGANIRQMLYWGADGTHSPLNIAYINDASLNPLADKQIQQLKADERKQTYQQMEPIMAEQQYYISYSSSSQTWFWDPGLRNVQVAPQQGSIRYAMRWWFDKP